MRNEGKLRMGYYPTSTGVLDNLRILMNVPDEYRLNHKPLAFDPCCGQGEFGTLSYEGFKTVGVEMDHYRAEKARLCVHHFMTGDAFSSTISPGSVSLLFLNPPYDDGPGGKRLEYLFLKRFTSSLQISGVIAYIIPRQRLRGDIADYLAAHYEDLRVFAYPNTEYDQVVLLGVKRKRALSKSVAHPISATLTEFSMGLSEPTIFTREYLWENRGLYIVPPRPNEFSGIDEEQGYELKTRSVDFAMLHTLVLKSANIDKMKASICQVQQESAQMRKPPLAFHSGHLGLLMCSGYLDGVIGEGEDKHLIKGKVTKHYSTRKEYDSKGDLVEVTSESYSVSLKMLTPDGELRTLSGKKEDELETQQMNGSSVCCYEQDNDSFKDDLDGPPNYAEMVGEVA